ncbi:MAG: hypothetical protein LBP59_00820 [Planctomycetaceae bacterium]|jgi:hypothetical protein|nr:hypothetical protein [Planctomycetaceae bacterium]
MNYKTEKFEPSKEQIQRLKDLAEDWQEIWGQICTELYNRLPPVARKFVSQNDIDDFISYIIFSFYKKIRSKKLLADYDDAKGDIYQWLCNRTNITYYGREYRTKLLSDKIMHTHKKNSNTGKIEKNSRVQLTSIDVDEKYEKGNTHASMLEDKKSARYSIQKRSHELMNKLTNDPIILEITKPNANSQYACLQLYTRIDRADEKMNQLVEILCQTVRKSNAAYQAPDTIIREEHKIAYDFLEDEIEQIIDKKNDTNKNNSRYIAKTIQDLDAKLDYVKYKQIFSPLNCNQVVKLLNISRNNESQLRGRYSDSLPNLLSNYKNEYENIVE